MCYRYVGSTLLVDVLRDVLPLLCGKHIIVSVENYR